MNRSFVFALLLALVLAGCGAAEDEQESPETSRPGSDKDSSKEARAGRRGEASRGGRDMTPEQREKMREKFKSRPVPVAVASVQRGRVDAFYASTTTLTAEEEASVVARTQGVVEKIFVEEGDQVIAGQALAQLDTAKLKLEVARTEANIRSLVRTFERSRQLYETKMISPDAFDQAQYNLERERATLALQQHELQEATVRAPIQGVITLRHVKLGNTLSPNNPAFEIKRVDQLEAILNVPEKELAKLQNGQAARVDIDALENQSFEGVVKRVAPEIDASSGTFRVTVGLDNATGGLKPGMFARVNIRYDTRADTLLVSRDAVVTANDESSVFIIRNGLAQRQLVTTGYVMGAEIEVLEGLGEGDEVVVTGQGGLRDGSSVRVVSL